MLAKNIVYISIKLVLSRSLKFGNIFPCNNQETFFVQFVLGGCNAILAQRIL